MDTIKEAIRKENYAQGYELCEELLTRDSKYNNNYQFLSYLALCSMKVLTKEERAIYAFEKVLTLTETPVEQHQKIWKQLTQLYETKGMYSKVAHSNTQLYLMMKEKSNIERMMVLADIIIENHLKVSGSYHVGCEFIANHVLLVGKTYHDHCIKMISYLYDFYTSFIIEQKSNSNNTTSLGSASTAASDEQKRETQLIVDGYDSFDMEKVTQLLIECLQTNDSSSSKGDIRIIRLLLRYLSNKRLRVLNMHYNSQPNTSSWIDILTLGLSYYSLLGCKDETMDMVDIIIEAWLYSQEPYDKIAKVIEDVLRICPFHPAANMGKSFGYIQEGLMLSSISHASHCMNYWTDNEGSISSSTESISDLLHDIKSSIITWCLFISMITNAFVRFRSISLHDLQHYSQEMKSRFAIIYSYFPNNMRKEIVYMIPLTKVLSASVIGFGKDTFLQEQLLLPQIFTAVNRSEETYLTDIAELPISVQWLSIIVFYSLEFYNEANIITNFLLSKSPSITSWIISEQSFSQLLHFISIYKNEKMSYGESIPPISFLCRDIILNESEMTKLVRSFQSALKTGDKISSSIEAEVRFRIGLSLWLAGGKLRSDQNGSIASFLLSAKLDPGACHVYSYIGHYYHLEKKDKERAIKCYLKALGSNSLDEEAGLALSQIYLTENQENSALKLWSDIVDLSSNCQWCYALRGKYYLCKGDYDSAMKSFQRAVELLPDDVNSWHGLGLSYSNLQQNTAAYKAISKACQLAPNDIQINIALAGMERRMCMSINANKRYEKLSKLAPHNELVLHGSAACCLVMAYQNFSIGWTFGAAISIVNGISYIETLVKLFESKGMGTKFESIWKLLGDLSSFASNVSTDLAFIKTNDVNSFSIFKSPMHISGLGSGDLLADCTDVLVSFLKRGEIAYRKVIEIQEKKGNVDSESWYDLGMIIYQQVNIMLTLKGQGSILLSKLDVADSSIAAKVNEAKTCFIKGIRINPACSSCFNGLGVTIIDDDVVRQACFVRAIQCNNNTSALLNLGILFLRHNLESSAKSCFSSLQLIESSPQTWIAFGELYERKSFETSSLVYDDVNNSDAINKNLVAAQDAYYAALEVAKPSDALFGAAISWLKLHKYLSVEGLHLNIHITPNTFESIQIRYEVEMKVASYIRRNPINPLAWIILAWCLEIRGAFKDAIEVNKNGMKVVDMISSAGLENLADIVIESIRISTQAFVSSLKRCCVNGGINFDSYVKEHQIPDAFKNLTKLVKVIDIMNTTIGSKSNSDYNAMVENIINSFRTSNGSIIIPILEEAFQYCLHGMRSSDFESLIHLIRCLLTESKDSTFKDVVCSFLSKILSNIDDSNEQQNKELWLSLILCKSWVIAFFVESTNDKRLKLMGVSAGLERFPDSALLWTIKAEEADDLNEISGYAEKAVQISNEILRSSVVEKVVGSGLGKALNDVQLENECPWLSTLDLVARATSLRCLNNIAKGVFDDTSKSSILRCLRLDPSNDSMWLLLSAQTFSNVLLTSDDSKEYASLKLVARISEKFEAEKTSIMKILETLSSSGSEIPHFKQTVATNTNSWYYLGCLYSNKRFLKCSEYCFKQAKLDDDLKNILLSLLYFNSDNDISRSYAEKSKQAASKVIQASIWLDLGKKNKAVKVLSEALKEWKFVSICSFSNLNAIIDEASNITA